MNSYIVEIEIIIKLDLTDRQMMRLVGGVPWMTVVAVGIFQVKVQQVNDLLRVIRL